MKTIAVTYPGSKRDRDGKFTEVKLDLVAEDEFIGVNFISRNKPRREQLERKLERKPERRPEGKKRSYITF